MERADVLPYKCSYWFNNHTTNGKSRRAALQMLYDLIITLLMERADVLPYKCSYWFNNHTTNGKSQRAALQM